MSLLDRIAAYIQRTDELNRMHLEIGQLLEKNRELAAALEATKDDLKKTEHWAEAATRRAETLEKALQDLQVNPQSLELARSLDVVKRFLRT